MANVIQEGNSSLLCSNCRNVFALVESCGYKEDCMKLRIHSRFEQLVEAKENHCHLCHVLLQAFTSKSNPTAASSIEYTTNQLWICPIFTVIFNMGRTSKSIDWSYCPDQPLARQTNSPYSQPGLTSTWITKQLRTCLDEHSDCQKAEIPRLPDRVLDVGFTGQNFVRLKLTAKEPDFGRYLTLSHCWGDQKFLTLTTVNESSLEKQIPILVLPQTFQDAIEVTRAVGLQYLWIDSICIQQDSSSDWLEQSAKMGNIYRKCHFNIAATAASDGGTGLFTPQDPLRFRPVYVNRKSPHRDKKLELFQSDDTEVEEYSDLTYKTTLHHRAWVFQERLLSPRVLNFGNGGVVWECSQKTVLQHNQFLPLDLSLGKYKEARKFRDTKNFIWRLEILGQKIVEFPDERARYMQQIYGHWHTLVEIYSQTSLTNWHDKLIALSGLANSVQKHTQDEYLAGLWRGNLFYDLLWRIHYSLTEDQLPPAQKGSDWRAPTWSWARYDAQIYHYCPWESLTKTEIYDMASLSGSHIITKGYDSCGQLESARLTLSGQLFKVQSSIDEAGDILLIQAVNNLKWNVSPDTRFILENLKNLDDTKNHFLILPLLLAETSPSAIHGLLLERDGLGDQYRRVGVVVSCWGALDSFDGVLGSDDQKKIILV